MYTYIMELERTQIYLTRAEKAALSREARATGRSKSQLIREAIDHVYVERRGADLLAALEKAAGSWKRRQSGAAWVEARRSGRLARLHKP
jgi:predicted transcriptional regulator